MDYSRQLLKGEVHAAFADFEEQVWRMATCRAVNRVPEFEDIVRGTIEQYPVPPSGDTPQLWALRRLLQVAKVQAAGEETSLPFTDGPLRWLVRVNLKYNDEEGLDEVGVVDLLAKNLADFMYGTGNFDSSWGAATKLLLQTVHESPAADAAMLAGPTAGIVTPCTVATDNIHRWLPVEAWLALYAGLERTAKQSAARAQEVAERGRDELANAKAAEEMRLLLKQPEIVKVRKKVADGQRRLADVNEQLVSMVQQQPPPEKPEIQAAQREVAEAEDMLAIANQESRILHERYRRALPAEPPLHDDDAADDAAAEPPLPDDDAEADSETCNMLVLRRWMRSDRAGPMPKPYCPICLEADLTLPSLMPVGYRRAPPNNPPSIETAGVVLSSCMHILGVNCFRQLHAAASEENEILRCPMCRAEVRTESCVSLNTSVTMEFFRMAVEEREMMPEA
ncbi:hypothetical protein RB597_005570 [Gaeumannomyces tritici]